MPRRIAAHGFALTVALAAAFAHLPALAQETAAPHVNGSQSAPAAEVPDVREVQQALDALGYDPGPADGVMGPQTRAAIEAFQADQDLPETGEITAALARAIAGVRFRASEEAAALWDESAQALRALGYTPGDGGFATAKAEKSIAAFQAERGLEPTGAFSRRLHAAALRAAEQSPEARRRLCLETYRARAYDKAAKWCRRAAEAGDPEGQVWLGHIHYYGLAGERDYGTAARWYLRAARQGDSRAQTYLGVMYSKGRGVPRDPAAAQRWYRMATETE